MTMLAVLAAGIGTCVAMLAAHLLRTQRRLRRALNRLESSSSELERLQHAFTRFAPEAIVERIASSGIPNVGQRKEVTVLFADLIGFTATCERVDPGTLVRILNGYFERMTRAITSHQGHISTLIGDGILALFGALESNPWQSDDAVRSALAMRNELSEYNRELAAENLPTLAFGIGLHRGTGVAGLVGSSELMQFTVVGSVVNVAARVQELTRLHRVDVLLTRSVKDQLDRSFPLRELPRSELRGLSEPVETFALGGSDPAAIPHHYSV
jgi:adenylate cyclase